MNYYGKRITTASYRRLDKGSYVDEQTIEFFLQFLLNEHTREERKEESYIFPQHFNAKLKADKECNTSEFLQCLKQVDIFTKKYFLITLNIPETHCGLSIVCNIGEGMS